MEHTPGPWTVCSCGKCFTVGASDHPICSVEHGEWGDTYPAIRLKKDGDKMYGIEAEAYLEKIVYGKINDDVAKANALLIAAAPALLKVAKAALDWLAFEAICNGDNVGNMQTRDRLSAAIAQAEGGK